MYYIVLLTILFILTFTASMVISRSIKISWLLINSLLYIGMGIISYFLYQTNSWIVIISVISLILISGLLFNWLCCPNCDLFFNKVLVDSAETDRWETSKQISEKYGNSTRLVNVPVTKVQITNRYKCNHCGYIWDITSIKEL